MGLLPPIGFCLLLSVALIPVPQAAFAHDLEKMEKQMGEAEPYTQIVNKPAPGFSLQSPDGQALSLGDFGGKPVVLYFLYARCRDECPLHSLKIKKVQEQIASAELQDQIQFVAVATDIEDAAATADLMREYPKQYGIDSANWTFLFGGSGRETAGIELARAYGLEFTPTGEGAQVHGAVTHLIDPEGQMRARYHGLNFDTVSLVSYAAALLHGDHGAATVAPSGSAQNALRPVDWVLSAVGVVCILVLLWAGWTFLGSRGARREKTSSTNL